MEEVKKPIRNHYLNSRLAYFDIGYVIVPGEASHLNELVEVDEREVSDYTENLSGKLLSVCFSVGNFIFLSLSHKVINLFGEAMFFLAIHSVRKS